MTYVGAVVGAGFASGQEIYQFFGRFGRDGIIGIAVAGCLFGVLGFLALERGRRGHTGGFVNLLASLYPPWLIRIAEGVTTAFLVVGLGVVSSGGGTAIWQVGGVPRLIGAAATTAAVLLVVASGTRSVVRANAVLIPYLIVMVLIIGAMNWHHPTVVRPATAAGEWLVSALLYLSYNIFTGIMVLLGVGRTLHSRRQSLGAAFAGAAVLSVLAFVEHHTLGTLSVLGALPLVDVAARTHPAWGVLFSLCLWVALFTTGVAEAFALREQYGSRALWLAVATCLFGLFGFDRLVQVLYPVMGMVAVLLWIPLVYRGPKRGVPGG